MQDAGARVALGLVQMTDLAVRVVHENQRLRIDCNLVQLAAYGLGLVRLVPPKTPLHSDGRSRPLPLRDSCAARVTSYPPQMIPRPANLATGISPPRGGVPGHIPTAAACYRRSCCQ